MKVYRVELMIINFDQLEEEEIIEVIENTHYPNRCISPKVMQIEEKEIGKWSDDNPLNFSDMQEAEYIRLFKD